jgi:hypothetical protein
VRYEPCPSPPVLKAFKPKGRRKLWMHGLGILLQLLRKELSKKEGQKTGLNRGPNSRIFNKRNIANLNAQTWKVGWPW